MVAHIEGLTHSIAWRDAWRVRALPVILLLIMPISGPARAIESRMDGRLVLASDPLGTKQTAIAPGLLFAGRLGARITHLLDNGTEIGGEALLKATRNTRLGFAGILGSCSPQNPLCPRAMGDNGYSAVTSPVTGLASAGEIVIPDVRAGLDVALVSVRGGWGELSLGRDVGASVRLDARAPAVFSFAGPARGILDPLGATVVRARNDPSGSALKMTFLSTRLFGLRLGVSFTPGLADAGVDGPIVPDMPSLSPRLAGIVEAGLSFSTLFADAGWRVRSALTCAFGADAEARAGYGGYRAWGGGLEIERDGWRVGGRALFSNNARADGEGAYRAVEMGLARALGRWEWGVEMGWASDDLLALSGYHIALVGAHEVTGNVRIGAGLVHGSTDIPVAMADSALVRRVLRGTGIIAEMTIRFSQTS